MCAELSRKTSELATGSGRRKGDVGAVKGVSKPVDRTLRRRYEMKYVVSESKAAAIARLVET